MTRAAIGVMKTMSRKMVCVAFATLLFAVSFHAEAQQAKKVFRIGYMTAGFPSSTSTKEIAEAFRRGLRELGYVEGQNTVIEYRYAEGVADRFPNLAAELVQLKVDVRCRGNRWQIFGATEGDRPETHSRGHSKG